MHPHPQEDFHMHCPVENGKARAANGKAHQPRILIDPDLLPNPPKWMRAPNKKGRRSPDKRGCWRRDIKKTLNAQYGYPLPNDDAGRESFALLCHAAFARLSPEDIAQRINWTAAPWADWATRAELDALIDEVANRPRKLTKEIIGRELGLTQDLRMRPDVQAYSLWPIAYTRAQWKLDVAAKARARSARNYAKRRKGKAMTKKAQCADFLRNTLAYEPAPAARLLRLAVTLGLQKQGAKQFGIPMREACRELGIVRLKKGMGGGWWWGLPQAVQRPETPCFPEGDISGDNAPIFSKAIFLLRGLRGNLSTKNSTAKSRFTRHPPTSARPTTTGGASEGRATSTRMQSGSRRPIPMNRLRHRQRNPRLMRPPLSWTGRPSSAPRPPAAPSAAR